MKTRLLVVSWLVVLAACGGANTVPPASSSPATNTAAAPAPAVAATASASEPNAIPAYIQTAVDAPDRDPADKALDAGRKPGALLSFCGVPQGGNVAELGAGRGYTAELLARAVGPTGKVWGQNSQRLLDLFAQKPWSDRLAKPINKNVVSVVRDFDDPLPPEAKGLDVVIDNLFYHDTVWMKIDRDKMNRAILAALKPGGFYCVIDHSGRSGTGTNEVKTLHRIEESTVRDEIEKAGFRLVGESQAWRNANDARDWNANPVQSGDRRGTSDRFALKFVKP